MALEMLTEQEMVEAIGETETLTGIEAEVAAEAEAEAETESAPEAVIEAALEGWEGMEAEAAARPATAPRVPVVSGQIIRVLRRYAIVVVRRLVRAPALRAKLRAACQAGPAALTRFLAPLILRALPPALRLIARPFLARLIRALFRAICRLAGAARTQSEAEALEAMEAEYGV
ncbi:MAG: hypothetical protein IT372_05050 [Polyangiaceae bacterium]|nr:hypothetical protein [Polyangiaceae bacterium]